MRRQLLMKVCISWT